MLNRLKKTLIAALLPTLIFTTLSPAYADVSDSLPDIGTTAGSTLSINQELQMGDFYAVSYTHLTLPTTPYV